MRKSRYTDEQIIGVLHEWDAGAKVVDLRGTRGYRARCTSGRSTAGCMRPKPSD